MFLSGGGTAGASKGDFVVIPLARPIFSSPRPSFADDRLECVLRGTIALWQVDHEGRSLVRLALDLDVAAGLFDDGTDRGET
jgi:hypothetical protein